ncbi:alanine racemase [Halobacteriovorax sp. HLS]|uniref:alanine racemase n=1 Tax=Halobacteriovorax sp. HLS TaxID=2234000 RepID=UPI000FD849A6|nr:alanine racemase [Halobacteriovorax sp. HLS]
MRFRSRHVIDLGIFSSNYQKLKEICPDNKVLLMVKADAYGHGLVAIVRYAVLELGINEFGCATLGEALKLREELAELEFEVYVFSDIQLELEECSEIYLNRRIIPVISNKDDLNFFLSNKKFERFPLFLKFNTGMNRLGISHEEIDSVVKLLKSNLRKSISHLMTHFSSSSLSMKKNKRCLFQLDNFKKIKERLISEGIVIENSSISNSGAIEQRVGLEETHVRPGLMMYGASSVIPKYSHLSCWDGEIISRLETYIIKHFKVTKGQPVGYGATPCPEDGVVAIIALGYGDGFSTRFMGSHLYHKGKKGIVVGRVNMDMAQVFFKKDDAPELIQGELFVVWDHDSKRFQTLADESKSITYELSIQLTSRVAKTYI